MHACTGPQPRGPPMMQPGLWEIAVTMQLAGMPMAMPPQTIKKCITAAEAQKAESSVMQPQGRPGSKENCKMSNFTHNGRTMSWKGTCTGDADMTFTGSMTFDSPDHYTGNMDIQGTFSGQPMQMSESMDGRRIAASCAD